MAFNDLLKMDVLDSIRITENQTLLQKLLYEQKYQGQYDVILSKVNILSPKEIKEFYEKDCLEYEKKVSELNNMKVETTTYKRFNPFQPVSFPYDDLIKK